MSWNPIFILLILFSTLLDYFVALRIEGAEGKNRGRWLAVSMIGNLGLLGFFKYTNFLIDSVNGLVSSVAGADYMLSNLDITLPVGISFYTFQTMSYTIDVYRRQIHADRNFIRFGMYVTYFPQLVAGPIVRAVDFLPQLQQKFQLNREDLISGIKLFAIGFFKKLFISDMISPIADNAFSHIESITPYEAILGIVAYTVQVYCDFSGYSDMAIGVARMMGYRLLDNFNMPFSAKDITEFWRNWHISLSSWLRDYLYIPLGGNRKGKNRATVNLMITMTLCGLWHGANWTFVVFGVLQGVFLVIHKEWRSLVKLKQLAWADQSLLWSGISWALTISSFMGSLVIFRSDSFSYAMRYFARLGEFRFQDIYYIPQFYLLLTIVVVAHVLAPYLVKNNEFIRWHRLEPIMYATILLLLLVLAPTNTSPFVYFQF
ncbi:MAG: MBOAT family O-acyltransferase [Candidatus Delongbacteria bacterium]